MIYEKNLEALQKRYQPMYKAIEEHQNELKYNIASVEEAKNGEKIVKVKLDGQEIYLNSRYNPSNEAYRYMEEMYDMPDESVLILYGFANGSFLREYINNSKKKTKCVVFEPSPAVFLQVLQNIDITDLLVNDRIYIAVEGISSETFSMTVGEWLQIFNKDTNRFLALPKYIEIFHDEYEQFKHELIDLYEKLYIVTNTAVDSGKRIVKNDINNMKFLPGCRCATELTGKFPEDMPAIVVSAGPSLKKNIDLLKEAKGKALIFVVDTALPKVEAVGVTPDMIISIDGAKSVNHFKVPDVDSLPFFVDMDSNTEVLEYVNSKNLFFFTSDSVIWDDLFKKVGSEIVSVETGGSVATAAIANLIAWGFKTIILIGQDLTFTGNRMHEGEDEIEFDPKDERYTFVKDINGVDTIIRKDYYIYLKWIEEMAYRFQYINFIDATEGGSVKKNLQQMTLREAIDTYCKRDYDISSILESVPRLFVGEDIHYVLDALEKMKKDFKNMKKQLTTCMADCRKGKRILESGENDIRELKRINASIKKTDELIEDSDERMYIYKYMALAEVDMMQDMYMEEEDDIKESIRMYDKSRKYYEDIVRQIPELIEVIEDCQVQIEKGEQYAE